MDIRAKIIEIVSNFEAKDWLTLTASACALVISILSFRQKATESQLSLRKQLTDLFEKLSVLNTEAARFRAKRDEYPPNYLGLLGDQRRFLVRQAGFIVTKLPHLVSPFEYLLLAGGYDEINDWSQAEHFFRLAIDTASEAVDRGIAIRGFARYLYNNGRLEEAREGFSEALACFKGDADRVRVFRADTLERQANHEREWAGNNEANRLLEDAIKEYEKLENPTRQLWEVKRVRAVISPPQTTTTEATKDSRAADTTLKRSTDDIQKEDSP